MVWIRNRAARAIGVGLCVGLWLAEAAAQESVEVLDPISVSADTSSKPQSKVWRYADRWWAVLASDGRALHIPNRPPRK